MKEIVIPKLKDSGDKIKEIIALDKEVKDITSNIQTIDNDISSLESRIDTVSNDNLTNIESIKSDYEQADSGIISLLDNLKIDIDILKEKANTIKHIETVIKSDNTDNSIIEEIQGISDRLMSLELIDDTAEYTKINDEIKKLDKKITEIYNIDTIVGDINKQKEIIEPTAIKGLVDAIRKLSVTTVGTKNGGGGGSGTTVSLKTNNIANGSQSILNLKQGSGITIADDGVGGVTVTSIAGGGSVTSVGTGTGLTGGPITGAGTVQLNTKLAPADTLTGNSLKVLRVNAGETAVEYATISGSGTVTNVSSATADATVTTPTTTPVITIVSAPKLTTARTIGIATGDATSAGSTFDGTANNTNALTLATVNANVGSFGLAGSVGQFVVTAKGLITSAVNVAISITASQVSDFTTAVNALITGKANTTTTISTTAPLAGGGDLSANRTLTTSMTTNKLIGRGTAGTGVMEEITLGTNLSLTGTTLNASGGGTPASPSTSIQFNNAGSFGGDATLTFNNTTKVISHALAGTPLTLTNPTYQATNSIDNFTQASVQNKSATANSSADLIVYPDNNTNDSTGFTDMGVASSAFSQAAYAITTPNDSYLFGSAVSGAGKVGNLVVATDSTGSSNSIVFGTNGFGALNKEKARIDGATGALSLGFSAITRGVLKLFNPTNSNTVTIQSGVTTTSYTMTLPTAVASANQVLTDVAGNGTLSWSSPAGSGDMVLATAQTNTGVKTFLDATLGLRNVANTITSFFTNTATVARTYTLKDASGTLAFTSDITGTNSGTNTGDQTSIIGITGTKAQFNTAVTDGDIVYLDSADTITGAKTFSTAPIFNALPTGSAVASSTTASTIATRDSNANLSNNNLLQGYTTTATAAGTTTLTVASTYLQFFTGATTQTLVLPVASTLTLGHQYYIKNNSIGAVTVQSSGSNTVKVIAGGTRAIVTCILTSGTTSTSWSVMYVGLFVADGKVLAVNNSLSLSGTDGTTMTFQGTDTYVGRTTTDTLTNKTMTGTNNVLTASLLKSATTEVSVSAATAPTTGQVLTATSGTVATWQTPSGGSGTTWTEVTTTTQTAVANNGYITNNVAQVVVTLPSTATVGNIFLLQGSGAGGWRLSQNASQTIVWDAGAVAGTNITTAGTGGFLSSSDRYDSVEVMCITTNTGFVVKNSKGNINIT